MPLNYQRGEEANWIKKFRLNITKERILTLSIIAFVFLLISANQVLFTFPVGRSGSIEYEYTTPIEQTANHTIIKESQESTNWALIQNITQFNQHLGFQIPRFDYDIVIFNLTLEPINGPKDIHFLIHLGVDDNPEILQIISSRTTLTLQPDLEAVKSGTNRWILNVVPQISPKEDFEIHCLEVWAYSSVPLCPVTVDIRTTNNESIFDNDFIETISFAHPVLELMRDNISNSLYDLYPKTANYTYYLRPTWLIGIVEWFATAGRSDIEVTFGENESVYWIIILKSVRVDLTIDVDYPLCRIVCLTRYDRDIYDVYLTPSQLPTTFYIPVHSTEFKIHLVNLLDTPDIYRVSMLSTAESTAVINGTRNIQINATFGHQMVIGYYPLLHILISFFSISLFFVFTARFYLFLRTQYIESRRKHVFGFRLLPVVLFCILAIVPWFFSTRDFSTFRMDNDILIHSASLGPLPIIGFWTEGSPVVLGLPSQAIEWFFTSFILYWLPLLLCILFLTTPSYRFNDIVVGLFSFGPVCFGALWRPFLPSITGGPYIFTPAVSIALLIPIAWIIGVVLSWIYYVFRSDSPQVEHDEPTSKELESDPSTEDKEDNLDIFFSIRFYVFVFLTFFAPSLVGVYTPSIGAIRPYFVSPIEVLSYLFYDLRFSLLSTPTIGALLVGIPYALFTLASLIWAWQWMNKQKSLTWPLLGIAISLLSMLPGLSILSLYRSYWSWLPIPCISVLLFLYLIANWMREAYDMADEELLGMGSEMLNHNEEDE